MNQIHKTVRPSVVYLSHGGGPLPLLGDKLHQELMANLTLLATKLDKPAAIIVISAHWEETQPTITAAATPSLLYDYSGFPAEAYAITYPAAGNPRLAHAVQARLHANGIPARLDERRGFDHGLFVPLKRMYPDADIPCLQVSLLRSLDPAAHVRLGEALAGLQEHSLLIIGSGFSFHNLRAFFSASTDESRSANAAFHDWLVDTCTNPELDEAERRRRLIQWESAPAARYCHPREEHLLPLHVCYGVAQRPASEVLTFEVMGKKACSVLWY